MRNGTHFKKLTLVDSSQEEHEESEMPIEVDTLSVFTDESHHAKTTVLVFLSVSFACAAAAVATGSYAAWLSRQMAARKALTDVNDILRSCQARMRQLETDVQRLPSRKN